MAFHLDHTDDRPGYRGPSHPYCNLSAAGQASHRTPGDGGRGTGDGGEHTRELAVGEAIAKFE